MPRPKRESRRRYLVQAICLLAFSLVLIPISAEARASWIHFASDVAIRLAIVLIFAAATSRVLAVDNVKDYRINVAPVEPSPASVSALAVGHAAGSVETLPRPNPRRTPTFWLLLAAGTTVFLFTLIRQIAEPPLLRWTPAGVISVLGDVFNSFSAAFLAICVVLTLMAWVQRPATMTRTELIRRRSIDISVGLFVAFGCWFYHTPWWDCFLQWGIGIFCWTCFIVLWMPKPTSRPELLSIVPSTPPDPGIR
jgi:hypothetical protein